ncbi:pyridoxal 5'-phosphate synthase glutaminase subunit PdxT [Demequina muriae]|uniref:Pyridoxal 5'-phosphate synthase subunit PdxT n=1 Tax=Demequina muriae TaxID=3051664 RepID=A0ABT8GJN1_9MICO|nr:pyridoxal 5'-phosphate synthase glutaminase subunit PdxT [Demequina sp. EGI L300058]MDN4481647.1 pyridoxal 5'-phosphate synthase glutaminase subunit PdxT [Demequina sp. EGI L300058]
MTTVGVLALQGDVREHQAMLEGLGVDVIRVRRLAELTAVDGLVIPGGESTTIDKLLRAFDLRDALVERIAAGLPVLGSCAGMVLLARDLRDGIEGQQTLGAIPMTVRRNAFGRQVDSAEVDLVWEPDGSPMHATFIRAPWVESYDDGVEVLATATGPDGERHPVAVRHGAAIATSFHPEISADTRVHELLLSQV